MGELLLVIIIACSLGLGGCTNSEVQEDTEPKTKVEENTEKEEKTEEKETEEQLKKEDKKEETKKTETKQEKDEEQELIERVSKRNIVIGNCHVCDKVLQRSDDYEESLQYGFTCRSCYNKGVTKCSRCGKTINSYDDSSHTGSSGVYCDDCYDAMYADDYSNYSDDYGDYEYYCDDCGSGLNQEEVCRQNGKTLCPDCAFSEDLREQGLDHQQ